MGSAKLMNDLFEKIRRHNELVVERSGREDASDLAIPDLYEEDDEYAGLCVQIMDLQDEIDVMLLDSKYAPLVGLSDSQTGELSFFIESSDFSFDQNIEKHLDFRLLTLKEEMKKRLKSIKILRLQQLDPHMCFLYDEVIRCFINGAFEASCVLSRAISELLVKDHIKKSGHGDYIRGEKTDSDKMTLIDIVKKYKLLSKPMIKIWCTINRRANGILHEKDSKTEVKALASIQLLQSFIKDFPVVKQGCK